MSTAAESPELVALRFLAHRWARDGKALATVAAELRRLAHEIDPPKVVIHPPTSCADLVDEISERAVERSAHATHGGHTMPDPPKVAAHCPMPRMCEYHGCAGTCRVEPQALASPPRYVCTAGCGWHAALADVDERTRCSCGRMVTLPPEKARRAKQGGGT